MLTSTDQVQPLKDYVLLEKIEQYVHIEGQGDMAVNQVVQGKHGIIGVAPEPAKAHLNDRPNPRNPHFLVVAAGPVAERQGVHAGDVVMVDCTWTQLTRVMIGIKEYGMVKVRGLCGKVVLPAGVAPEGKAEEPEPEPGN